MIDIVAHSAGQFDFALIGATLSLLPEALQCDLLAWMGGNAQGLFAREVPRSCTMVEAYMGLRGLLPRRYPFSTEQALTILLENIGSDRVDIAHEFGMCIFARRRLSRLSGTTSAGSAAPTHARFTTNRPQTMTDSSGIDAGRPCRVQPSC